MFLANILLFINIIVAVLLVVLILLQRTSTGLGALGGGSSAAFSSSSLGSSMTKATAILATIFMATCLLLAINLKGQGRDSSVVDSIVNQAEPVATEEEGLAPALPSGESFEGEAGAL